MRPNVFWHVKILWNKRNSMSVSNYKRDVKSTESVRLCRSFVDLVLGSAIGGILLGASTGLGTISSLCGGVLVVAVILFGEKLSKRADQ